MPKPLASLLCLISVVAVAPASAYEIDSHERLTREAVSLIARCARRQASLRDPSPYLQTLIDLNARQDDTLRKAVLWHFPFVPRDGCANPCNQACYSTDWCPYWLSFICSMPVYRSFDPWVRHLIRRASYAHEPVEVYRAAGALLHYVQDLAVPAHALPVFHPVPLWHGDELDAYEFTVTHGTLQLSDASDPCVRLDQVTNLAALLVDVRAMTVKSLQAQFPLRKPQGERRNWGVFWRSLPDPRAPEFYPYGCKAFGERRVDCSSETFEVDEATYARFVNERASEAILASAQVIVFLQRQIQASALPGGEDADAARDRWLPSQHRLQRIAREHPEACKPLGTTGE